MLALADSSILLKYGTLVQKSSQVTATREFRAEDIVLQKNIYKY
jgi:hypothetical protein